MSARQYSSIVPPKTLSSSVTSSGTTLVLSDGTGLPSAPYTLVIEPDTANEEIVTVTAGTYTGLTVVRGVDGTTGVAHSSASVVRHMLTARDVQEAQNHVEASSAYTINDPNASSGTVVMPVHGITTGEGNVVGTAKTQTLTNKTLTSPIVTTSLIATGAAVYLSEGYLHIGGANVTASAAELNKLDGVTATTTELNYTDGLGDAWSSHTPTVTGSWTSVSASTKYRKIGRIVHFRTSISATSVGPVSSISFTLPATPAGDFAFAGWNGEYYPMACIGGTSGASAATLPYGWDSTSTGFVFSGTYESAS